MVRNVFKCLLLTLLTLIVMGGLLHGQGALSPVAARQASPKVFRFVALGDMGTGDKDQLAVAGAMTVLHRDHPFDTVLMLGDNIYPDGNPADLPAKFERPYAELLKLGVRFYATLGNHDVDKGRQAEINYPNFNMGGRSYYSFVKSDGLIEFLSLDSTAPDKQQMQWLDETLSRSTARWKVAFFHHPIYSSAKTHGSDKRLREMLEPLLVKHGVVAAFSGHDHTYERTKPQNGVQYFVSGTGGKLRKGNLNRRSEFFETGDDQRNSFMMIEVSDAEFRYSAISSDGEVLDSGVIRPASTTHQAGSSR